MISNTLLILLGLASLVPFFTAYTLRWSLQLVGWSLKKKTEGRRQALLERVRLDEVTWQSTQQDTNRSEDEEWEKVEGYSGAASDTAPQNVNWEGIIGFFHPFW